MSKTKSRTGERARRSPLLLWGVAAVFALAALAAVSVLIAGGPGGRSSAAVERPVVGGDLHAMAVDPKNVDHVMVGGHEGAAISENGGKTWRQVSDLEGADPMGWAIDPTDPKKMYAGGHPGFYRSEDGGETWSKDNSGLPGTDVHGLGMDPRNPDTLYASIMGAGLYRTTEAGESWEPVNTEVGVMGPILVDPRASETLFVAGMEGGFFRSEDSGKSWSELGTIPGGTTMWVSQSFEDPDTFYAANGGVAKSTDGGESWQPMDEGLPEGVSTVAVASNDKRVVYAGVLEGTEARVYRSEDGGESWETQN
ncbi:MAG TPA: hypothetical protein VGP38_03575 [Rubrobacter sp.]|nr:hypothetical protein [Rubrobacter sp.]